MADSGESKMKKWFMTFVLVIVVIALVLAAVIGVGWWKCTEEERSVCKNKKNGSMCLYNSCMKLW